MIHFGPSNNASESKDFLKIFYNEKEQVVDQNYINCFFEKINVRSNWDILGYFGPKAYI